MQSPETSEQPITCQTDAILRELRTLIGDLGKDGGIISPSVYDTAQVLRFYPPKEGVEPELEWLLSQQQADGGWGDAAFPMTRDAPTLAAVLAISTHTENWRQSQAVLDGLRFINSQSSQWNGLLPDDVPVAAELIIPILVQDAVQMDLPVRSDAYESLALLGARRRQIIAHIQPQAGTTAVYSWEAWGGEPLRQYLDAYGSVGHSPAATAFWLQKASQTASLNDASLAAERYLEQASLATHSGIPGLYPTAWPLDRFEQAFGLYALLSADMLTYSNIQTVVAPHIDELVICMQKGGIGFTDHFEPDGDNTAAVVAVLGTVGVPEAVQMLDSFRRGVNCISYPYELQPSISVTARALHGYHVCASTIDSEHIAQVLAYRDQDGRWTGDKWNVSWIYTTAHMLLACADGPDRYALEISKRVLLMHQKADGSWGAGENSSQFETALAVIGLYAVDRQLRDEAVLHAFERARAWLLPRVLDGAGSSDGHGVWLNKELFRVPRIERTWVLVASILMNDVIPNGTPFVDLNHEADQDLSEPDQTG